MSASYGDKSGHPARATFGVDEADSKKVVKALGNKSRETTLAKESSFSIGHTCGGRLFTGTKKYPLIHTYYIVG